MVTAPLSVEIIFIVRVSRVARSSPFAFFILCFLPLMYTVFFLLTLEAENTRGLKMGIGVALFRKLRPSFWSTPIRAHNAVNYVIEAVFQAPCSVKMNFITRSSILSITKQVMLIPFSKKLKSTYSQSTINCNLSSSRWITVVVQNFRAFYSNVFVFSFVTRLSPFVLF